MGRVFKPKRKVAHHVKIGGGALYADFYLNEKHPEDSHLHIYAPNHIFEQKIQGFTLGYLLESVRQGKEEEVEAYCAMLWRVSNEVYEDIDFCNDIIKAITNRDNRLMNKGAENAAKVTEEQEMADQALMTDVAREADKLREE